MVGFNYPQSQEWSPHEVREASQKSPFVQNGGEMGHPVNTKVSLLSALMYVQFHSKLAVY